MSRDKHITSEETELDEKAIHRSFAREVERRIESLRGVRVETIASLRYGEHTYPLYGLHFPADSTKRRQRVFISAGVHGDEPAGVHAAIDFLSEHVGEFASEFEFVVLPCVNPSGYETNTMLTMSGVNLNRSFGLNHEQSEIRAIESWLSKRNASFRVAFDLHEIPPYYEGEGFVATSNPKECYLYETVTDDSTRIGPDMISALPSDIEICRWPTIYEDRNENGVVAYPEACRNRVYAQQTSLDAYLNGRHTAHSFTTETPTVWSLEKRISTHVQFLKTALRRIVTSEKERSVA